MATWLKPKVMATVAVIVVGTTGAAASFTHDSTQVVYADFTDASTIQEGQDVKVHGVTVGRTGRPELDPERKTASIPLHLDPSAFPLHENAKASVAPVTLLGERYVRLEPGTPAKPALRPDAHIPASRTSLPVDLQDVVNSLDDPTAGALAAFVTTLGQGVGGNGKQIQRATKALAPAMRDTGALMRVLQQQNALLGNVVDRVGPVAAALAADGGKRLGGLVDASERMLGATASRDAQLGEMLRELPSTLKQARKTLGRLTGTSDATTTVLGNLRPATDDLRTISDELVAFADSADPALASAKPVLDRANALLDKARPVAAELAKAGPGLRASAKGARPISTDLRNNIGDVLSFIRYWALTTNGRDGLSHYFRGHYVLTPDQATGLLLGGENGTPEPENRPEPRPKHDEPSYDGSSPLPLPGGLLEPSTKDGGATGLNADQERSALGFLLGGL